MPSEFQKLLTINSVDNGLSVIQFNMTVLRNSVLIMKIRSVSVLFAIYTVVFLVNGKEDTRLSFCYPCDGNVSSESTTKYIPKTPKLEAIAMNLKVIHDQVNTKLATMMRMIVGGAEVNTSSCRNKNVIQKHRNKLKKLKRRMLYSHHVYANMTAIAVTLKSIEEQRKTLPRLPKDDNSDPDYSEIDTEINKLLCKIKIYNHNKDLKNQIKKCKRKRYVFKARRRKEKVRFILCGLMDAVDMLENMITVVDSCTQNRTMVIQCPGISRHVKRKRPKKRKNRRRRTKKQRRRNRKGHHRQQGSGRKISMKRNRKRKNTNLQNQKRTI